MNYIFDFDGTIVDSLEAFIAVFNKNIRSNDDPLSSDEIQTLRGMTSRRALKHLGVHWWQIPKLIIEGIPDFHSLLSGLQPFVGLSDVIKQLHGRGDNLFIVTSNTEGSVREFLKQHKLEDYFTAIDTGAGIFKKAKHIRKMIGSQKLKRRETVYIGDETRDIQAARLALVKIVSVTWGFNTRQVLKRLYPNYIIDDPYELLNIKL